MIHKITRSGAVAGLAVLLVLTGVAAYAAPGLSHGGRGGAGFGGAGRDFGGRMGTDRDFGRSMGSDRMRSERGTFDRDRSSFGRVQSFGTRFRDRDGDFDRDNFPRHHRFHGSFFFGFGDPFFYSPFYGYPYSYYGYNPYYYPPRPVWRQPAPVTLTDSVVAQWVDPVALRLNWTGSLAGMDRFEVGVLDGNNRLLKHRYAGRTFVVTVDIPNRAAFLRLRALDAGNSILYESIVPLPPR